MSRAQEIIRALQLVPHPEGGHYRETFRDADGTGGRPASTAIYYLLERGQSSRWHRVDAAEAWHFYSGDPLELVIVASGVKRETVILGPDVLAGQRPQAVVPAGAWQSARPLGDWVLAGCTVAPGFDFKGFELAPEGWEPGR